MCKVPIHDRSTVYSRGMSYTLSGRSALRLHNAAYIWRGHKFGSYAVAWVSVRRPQVGDHFGILPGGTTRTPGKHRHYGDEWFGVLLPQANWPDIRRIHRHPTILCRGLLRGRIPPPKSHPLPPRELGPLEPAVY